MNKRHYNRIFFSLGFIFSAFVVLVIAFLASSLFVLDVASKSANDLKRQADKRAVSGMLQREFADLSQRQSEVTWWDDSIQAINNGIDRNFFSDAMLNWFPNEYDIDRSAMLSPENKVLLHAEGIEFVDNERASSFASQTADLVQLAQQKYLDHRIEENGEFRVEGSPILGSEPLFVMDVRRIDNVLGIVMAQAIVPDDELSLPQGPAHILVVSRPFSETRLAKYAREIDMNGLVVASVAPQGDSENIVEIPSQITGETVYVSWENSLPSEGIWSDSMPALSAMLSIIAIVMFGVTYAYARLIERARKAEARNRYLANHDVLTGLPNRNKFDRALQGTINDGHLDNCAVLCLDLDNFKPVNDTFGHQAGDTVLRMIADRIEKLVGEKGMVARLGGDEFIVLLKECTEKNEVMFLCDNLIESVGQVVNFEDYDVYVDTSIGVAWWPDDALTADMVIRSADQALYRAKAMGRARAVRADQLETEPNMAAQIWPKLPQLVAGAARSASA